MDNKMKIVVVRPEVGKFAKLMENQLKKHDDRPGWSHTLLATLFTRLLEEMAELHEALYDESCRGQARIENIGMEAADVANFAMMIADNCGCLKQCKNTQKTTTGHGDLESKTLYYVNDVEE